jgi:hypothetical protein
MPATVLMLIGQVTTATLPTQTIDHFDLAALHPPADRSRCGDPAATTAEIIVCGRKDMAAKLDSDRFREKPVDLGFRLLGANARPVAVQRTLPNGASAPALMLNLNWKF